jgi:hypothetical protein
MNMVVRYFHSADVPDLSTWEPESPTNVAISLEIAVGPKDEIGEETFELFVMTPEALSERVPLFSVYPGRHHLFVERWDWPLIERYLRTNVEAAQGASWRELTTVVGRLGRWEFEDYDEDSNSRIADA